MTKTVLDIQEIFKRLPHRPPFLLVDRVLDVQPGKSLVAIKNVTINEPFFLGHFPGEPVMPGVLTLEALAQASGIFAFVSLNENADDGTLYFLAGIDNARFKRIVRPGDQLRLEVEFVKQRKNLWMMHGVATVDGEVACSADFLSIRMEGHERDR